MARGYRELLKRSRVVPLLSRRFTAFRLAYLASRVLGVAQKCSDLHPRRLARNSDAPRGWDLIISWARIASLALSCARVFSRLKRLFFSGRVRVSSFDEGHAVSTAIAKTSWLGVHRRSEHSRFSSKRLDPILRECVYAEPL
jgi:hypothetical protein